MLRSDDFNPSHIISDGQISHYIFHAIYRKKTADIDLRQHDKIRKIDLFSVVFSCFITDICQTKKSLLICKLDLTNLQTSGIGGRLSKALFKQPDHSIQHFILHI